jgi:hypothetical protein
MISSSNKQAMINQTYHKMYEKDFKDKLIYN